MAVRASPFAYLAGVARHMQQRSAGGAPAPRKIGQHEAAAIESLKRFVGPTRRAAPRVAPPAAKAPEGMSSPRPRPASPIKRSPAKAVDFAHLRAAASVDIEENDEERYEAELERWSGTPNVPDPAYVAGRIIKAAEKARRPTSGPAPTGLAAEIVDAGKKRRGEI